MQLHLVGATNLTAVAAVAWAVDAGVANMTRAATGGGTAALQALAPAGAPPYNRSAGAIAARLRDMEDDLDARLRDVPAGAAQGAAARSAAYADVADEVRLLFEVFDVSRRV